MSTIIIKAVVENLKPGNIEGQKIAYCRIGEEGELVFDVLRDLISINPSDEIEVVISENKPENIDQYEFCGHGYLVTPESKFNKTILSLWGIIFKFKPPLKLQLDKKYYLCLKHT
ncbi:MAG: DNA-directed RNA polymerase subunit G [Acidilobaceae archaeon]